MTFVSLWFEAILPFIILFLWRFPKVRMISIALVIVFHLMIACSLELGMVTPYTLILWLIVIPAIFWSKIPERWQFHPKKVYSHHKLATALATLYLIVILAGNWLEWNEKDSVLKSFFHKYQLNQTWSLFSNREVTSPKTYWIKYTGKFSDGKTKDLISGQSFSAGFPASSKEVFPDVIYKHYILEHFIRSKTEKMANLRRLAFYYCRTHTDNVSGKPDSVQFTIFLKTIEGPVEQLVQKSFNCSDSDLKIQ